MLEHHFCAWEQKKNHRTKQQCRANFHPIHRVLLKSAIEKEKPRYRGFVVVLHLLALSVITAQSTQYVQQADEDIINAQIQRHGRQYIVSFTTMNNAAGIIQNETAHNHNNDR